MKVGEWYTTIYKIPCYINLEDLEELGAKFYINADESYLLLENVEHLISEKIKKYFPKLLQYNIPFKILRNGKICYVWLEKEK